MFVSLLCLPAASIRLFINSEVMSGRPDLRGRSSEKNVVTQEPQGEVHGAFVGQTELHQKQAPGTTEVPKDETTAHLSEGPVQEEAQDITDKVEEEIETRIQEARKTLEDLSLTRIKAWLEGTTHTIKSEVREKAQDVKGRRQTSDVKDINIRVEPISCKDIQEGPKGIMYLKKSLTSEEAQDIKYQQEEEFQRGVKPTLESAMAFASESKLKCFFFSCKYQN